MTALELPLRRATFARRASAPLCAVISLLLLCAGCSVGPNYRRPDLAAPTDWREAQQSGIKPQSADLTRWWAAFNDPALNSLVERAVQSNLDLRIAEGRIREARAVRAVTAAGEWPTLDASGSYMRNRISKNALSLPFSGGGGISAFPGIELDQNLYKAGFDASWEIDVFGGVRRGVEAADANIEAAVENRRDALVTLLGDVAKNYIDLRGFQRRLAVAQQTSRHSWKPWILQRSAFKSDWPVTWMSPRRKPR
jgi:outer membrane protein, multidrug efflux system